MRSGLARAPLAAVCLALACPSRSPERAPNPRDGSSEVEGSVASDPSAARVQSASPVSSAEPGSRSPASGSAPARAGLRVRPEPSLPPPFEGPRFRALPVSGFADAVVAVPIGAREPRPLIVATHGNFDRPEWQCEVWSDVTDGYPFVLCPRGERRPDVPKSLDRYTYANAARFRAELVASLGAFDAEYSGRALAEAGVFIGFSLGAIYGAPLLESLAPRMPYAVLVEGGLGALSAPLLSRFQKAGGRGIVFGCGQAGCTRTARDRARLAERRGLLAALADGGSAGHTYDGSVAAAVRGALGRVVAADSAWRGAAFSAASAEAVEEDGAGATGPEPSRH